MWLTLVTAVIALLSEWIMDAIKVGGAVYSSHMLPFMYRIWVAGARTGRAESQGAASCFLSLSCCPHAHSHTHTVLPARWSQGASLSLGVPMPFLVTIILPIVGNAAEHASAIVFAYKNKVRVYVCVRLASIAEFSH